MKSIFMSSDHPLTHLMIFKNIDANAVQHAALLTKVVGEPLHNLWRRMCTQFHCASTVLCNPPTSRQIAAAAHHV